MADHAGGDIRMKVKACNDRQVISGEIANPGKQLALAILMGLGHHGAMEIKIDTIK
jgi:hypothetical protein